MADEEIVFTDEANKVTVSTARLVFGQKTMAMANITSVSTKREPAPTGGPVVIALAGGLLSLIGGGLFAQSLSPKTLLPLAAGIGLLVLGIHATRSAKPTFWVIVSTAGAETKAFKSSDKDLVERITGAINDAMVRRG
jgi:hypothetical protein